jgi:hypothetical protein
LSYRAAFVIAQKWEERKMRGLILGAVACATGTIALDLVSNGDVAALSTIANNE